MGMREPEYGAALTMREASVRDEICKGGTREDVAKALGISIWTVKYYAWRVFVKTGARNAADLVRITLTERYEGQPAAVDLSKFEPKLSALIKAGMA
jgi:DNA-binding NarL/FixJ family response regulator